MTKKATKSSKTKRVVGPPKVIRPARVTKVQKAKVVDKIVERDTTSVDTRETADTKSDESVEIRTRFDTHRERLGAIDAQITALQRERKKVYGQMIRAHSSDMKKAHKDIEKVKSKIGKRGGFVTKKNPVGGELANFLGVDDGTEFTSGELTSKFWEVMRFKHLVGVKNSNGKIDNRIFKVTQEIRDVFGVPASASRIKDFDNDKGFNFTTYQRYLSDAQRNNNGEYSTDE